MPEENLEQATTVEGGVVQPTDSGPVVPLSEEDLLSMDPDYQEMAKAEKDAANPDSDNGDSDDGSVDDNDNPNTDNEDDTGDTTSEDNKGDDDTDDDTAQASDTKFEDDILPGLKGEKFEALDEEVQEVIAKSRTELDEAKAKAERAQKELDLLSGDPIVKHRKSVIESGQENFVYKEPEIDDATFDKMQSLIDDGTPESKVELKKLLGDQVKAAAETAADNARIALKDELQREQYKTDASKKVIALAGLLKVELPSDDPSVIAETKFDNLGEVGKVMSEISKMHKKGIIADPHKYLAEISAEEIYAQMAVKNGWPLLKNADKIVNKQIKASNEKLMSRFLKAGADEASGSFAKSSQMDKKAVKGTVVDGIDLIKLATDDSYHESVLYAKSDPKHFDRVAELRIQGERMVNDNPKLGAPRSNR